MSDSRLMISVSGIRGVVGQSLTPEKVVKFASAFGTWCGGGKVVVGRDSRVSGEMVRGLVVSSLIASGCDVVDIGLAATPTVEITTKNLKARGGIAITASHNPIQWNALKLIGPRGMFLTESQSAEVLEIAKNRNFVYAPWDSLGRLILQPDASKIHLQTILDLDLIDVPKIQARSFKVVLDCVAGAGALIAPLLLQALGCEAHYLHCEPHGIFPRNPEPSAENLKELSEATLKHQADLGIAIDPDADRVAFVSEKGIPLGEEYSLALAVAFVTKRKKGAVVLNASTSLASEDIALQNGCDVFRTRVGEINVSTRMQELDAVIGGEGNGGVILPEVHLGRDAATGIALVLQLMTEQGKPLSEIHQALPQYSIVKDRIELGKTDPDAAIERIQADFSKNRIDLTDGVKILFDRSWVHIRKSNTEPIVRVIAEAPTRDAAAALCKKLRDAFES